MTTRPHIAPFAATLLILLIASVPACKKKGTNSVTVTKELDSGTLANGAVYIHTFANAGTYGYHCAIHGTTMSGSVTVAMGQPAGAPVAIENNSYNPTPVSVAPGGTVTWTNNGVNHTVTSN